jgi:hypothetical protein
MWDRLDNQEVGLEAATLERVRNSSLVQWSCAENVPGLKPTAEAADAGALRWRGRGASSSAVKLEWKRGWSGDECECWYE